MYDSIRCNYILIFCVTLFNFTLIAQSLPNDNQFTESKKISNKDRYGLDYELLDYDFPNGDSTVLNEFDITKYFVWREEDIDKSIWQLEIGLEIILFSKNRSEQEWNKVNYSEELFNRNRNKQ